MMFHLTSFRRILIMTGIIFADGPAAKEQRQFIIRNLKDFGAHGQSMESKVLGEVENLVSYLHSHAGQPQRISHFYYRNVVNSLLSILLSKKFDTGDPTVVELAEMISE